MTMADDDLARIRDTMFEAMAVLQHATFEHLKDVGEDRDSFIAWMRSILGQVKNGPCRRKGPVRLLVRAPVLERDPAGVERIPAPAVPAAAARSTLSVRIR